MNRVRAVFVLFLLVAMALFGAVGFWTVGRIKEEAQQFSDTAVRTLARAGEINSYQAEGYARTLQLLSARTSEERTAIHADISLFSQRMDRVLTEYSASVSGDDARRRYEGFAEKRKRYREIRNQVIALSDQGREDDAMALARGDLAAAYREYTNAGDVLFEEDVAAAVTHATRIREVCMISQIVAAVVASLGFAGGISLPFLLVWLGDGFKREPIHP